MARRPRLDPEIFHLPVDKMREGYYSDKYFVRTRELLLKDGHRPCVTMQVFGKAHAFLGGIDEAIVILKLCSMEWLELEVSALYDGDEIAPWETVLLIEGPYDAFAHLETLYLGVLARRTKVGTNTRRVVEAAKPKQVMFFPARHDHWLVQTGDGYAAHIAGAIGGRSTRTGSGTCASSSRAGSPSTRSGGSKSRGCRWTCTAWGRACSRAASTSPPTSCGSRANRWRKWDGAIGPTRVWNASNDVGAQHAAPLRFKVFVVPRQVPLQPVAPVARLVDAVVLPRIGHQLGFHAEASKRLVHLLRVEERDVEVLVAAQEQRRRRDPVGGEEGERPPD